MRSFRSRLRIAQVLGEVVGRIVHCKDFRLGHVELDYIDGKEPLCTFLALLFMNVRWGFRSNCCPSTLGSGASMHGV